MAVRGGERGRKTIAVGVYYQNRIRKKKKEGKFHPCGNRFSRTVEPIGW